MGGEAHQRQSDHILLTYAIWDRIKPLFIDRSQFGESAWPPFRALVRGPNPVAGLKPFHAGTGRDHRPGEIPTKNPRKTEFHRNHSTADVDIDGVHVNSRHFDQALSAARTRIRKLAELNNLGWSRLSDVCSLHTNSFC